MKSQARPISRPVTAQAQRNTRREDPSSRTIDTNKVTHSPLPLGPTEMYSTDDRGYVSTLKSEILTLQRKVDVLQAGNTGQKVATGFVTPRMVDIEQQLLALNFDPVDATSRYRAEVRLLDMLFSVLKDFGQAMLTRINPSAKTLPDEKLPPQRPNSAPAGTIGRSVLPTRNNPPQSASRISVFIDLADLLTSVGKDQFLAGISGRRIEKETQTIESDTKSIQRNGAGKETPLRPSSVFPMVDDISPAVASLKALIEHQRDLQSKMETTLAHQARNSEPCKAIEPSFLVEKAQPQLIPPLTSLTLPSPAKPVAKLIPPGKVDQTERKSSFSTSLLDEDPTALKAEVAQLTKELQAMTDQLTRATEEKRRWEADVSLATVATGTVAFANVSEKDYVLLDPATLQAMRFLPRMDAGILLGLTEAVKDALEQAQPNRQIDLASTFSSTFRVQKEGGSKDSKKGLCEDVSLKEKESEAILRGQLFITLRAQNASLLKLLESYKTLRETSASALSQSDNECKALKLAIGSLQERLKAAHNQHAMEVQRLEKQITKLQSDLEATHESTQATLDKVLHGAGPVVRHTQEAPSLLGREQAWRRSLNLEKRAVKDATAQLEKTQEQLQESESRVAVLTRERNAHLQAVKHSETLRSMAEDASRKARDDLVAIQQEMEKVKEDMSHRIKIENAHIEEARIARLELSIGNHTTNELRKEIENNRVDLIKARESLTSLRGDLERQRKEHEVALVGLQGVVSASKAEAAATRKQLDAALARERHGRREVERLQLVEYDMANIKRSFDNFAVAKSVMRTAAAEEELALKECVRVISSDSFLMPQASHHNDELNVELDRLEMEKDRLDSEHHVLMLRHLQQENSADEYDGYVSNKQILTSLLRSRMTDVQIFCVKQSLREMKNEKEIASLRVQQQEAQKSLMRQMAEVESQRATSQLYMSKVEELEPVRQSLMMANTAMKTRFDEMKETITQQNAQLKHNEATMMTLSASLKVAQMKNSMLAMDPKAAAGNVVDSPQSAVMRSQSALRLEGAAVKASDDLDDYISLEV